MTKARLISLTASLCMLAFYFQGAAKGLGHVGGYCFGWGPGTGPGNPGNKGGP